MQTQKQILKLTRKAYNALSDLDRKHTTAYREELFRLCKAEEKDHRGFIPSTFNEHHPDAASIADCARMFAVLRIAEYMKGDSFPAGKDYLHFQKSAFYAAGIVDEYRDEIDLAWSAEGLNIEELAKMDYCQLVSPKDAPEPINA